MKIRYYVIVFLSVCIIVAWLCVPYINYFLSDVDDYKVDINGNTAYFRIVRWGIMGTHERVFLSEKSKGYSVDYDPDHDYLYYETPVVYKLNQDSITIFDTSISKEPKIKFRRIVVVQVQMNQYQWSQMLENLNTKNLITIK